MRRAFWIWRCTLIIWCWAGMWTWNESKAYAKSLYCPEISPMKAVELVANNQN